MTSRTPFASRSRAAASAQSARLGWDVLLTAARETLAKGDEVSRLELASLQGIVGAARRTAFPVGYAAAQELAASFLILAMRYATTPDPESREDVAAPVTALAESLSMILSRDAAARLRAAQRGQVGDGE